MRNARSRWRRNLAGHPFRCIEDVDPVGNVFLAESCCPEPRLSDRSFWTVPEAINRIREELRTSGSRMIPGAKAEGVVVFHVPSSLLFKATCEKGKASQEATEMRVPEMVSKDDVLVIQVNRYEGNRDTEPVTRVRWRDTSGREWTHTGRIEVCDDEEVLQFSENGRDLSPVDVEEDLEA